MLAVLKIPCVVTIIVPAYADVVEIRLVGAVEMGAEAALDQAVDRVRKRVPGSVVIDLAGVTFAGSLLLHFLIRVHAAVPLAVIHLHQASPTVRFILRVTDVESWSSSTITGRPGLTDGNAVTHPCRFDAPAAGWAARQRHTR